MTATTEVELKLAIAKSDVAALKRHPLLAAAGAPGRQRLRNIYFDTPELALRENQCALRLRRAGRTWLQTFKQGGRANAGLHVRAEAEFTVSGPAIDLSRLAGVPGGEIFQRKRVAGRLIQIFEADFTRATWQVTDSDGSVVEVALDQGDIWSSGRSIPVQELELELISGQPEALFKLAAALQDSALLLPADASKAERGYRLFCDEEAVPVKAGAIDLSKAMTPAHAMREVIASCVSQLQANVPGVQACADSEFLHQARVALRRLRAAFALFAPKVEGKVPAYESLRNALREFARELGTARDWDVFVQETLEPICQRFPDDSGAAQLLVQARKRREAAAKRVCAILQTPRYARLLLDLSALICGARESAAAAAKPVRDSLRALARFQLARRHRRLCRDRAQIANADDIARHRLRIVAKKQRYAAEFFTGLFAAAEVARYTKLLSVVQDLLGRMNDVVSARALLGELSPKAASRVMVEAWLAAKADDALQDLPKACERIAAAPKFWRRD